jgi:hypothetical protein
MSGCAASSFPSYPARIAMGAQIGYPRLNQGVRMVSKIVCKEGASYDELNASRCPHSNFSPIRNLLASANSYHCFPVMPIPSSRRALHTNGALSLPGPLERLKMLPYFADMTSFWQHGKPRQ